MTSFLHVPEPKRCRACAQGQLVYYEGDDPTPLRAPFFCELSPGHEGMHSGSFDCVTMTWPDEACLIFLDTRTGALGL